MSDEKIKDMMELIADRIPGLIERTIRIEMGALAYALDLSRLRIIASLGETDGASLMRIDSPIGRGYRGQILIDIELLE